MLATAFYLEFLMGRGKFDPHEFGVRVCVLDILSRRSPHSADTTLRLADSREAEKEVSMNKAKRIMIQMRAASIVAKLFDRERPINVPQFRDMLDEEMKQLIDDFQITFEEAIEFLREALHPSPR